MNRKDLHMKFMSMAGMPLTMAALEDLIVAAIDVVHEELRISVDKATMEDKLLVKTCPFCGGPATLKYGYACCDKCIEVDACEDAGIELGRWNTRPREKALANEIMSLEARDIDHLACNAALVKKVEALQALLADVWKLLERYHGRLMFNMMLRGESRAAWEALRERVEKAMRWKMLTRQAYRDHQCKTPPETKNEG